MRVMEPGSQPSFFVTYNIPEGKVLSVYENTSHELLSVYEKHPEVFRPPSSFSDAYNAGTPGGPWQQHASTSANVHTLKIQKRYYIISNISKSLIGVHKSVHCTESWTDLKFIYLVMDVFMPPIRRGEWFNVKTQK